jgi:hypothetical protein
VIGCDSAQICVLHCVLLKRDRELLQQGTVLLPQVVTSGRELSLVLFHRIVFILYIV